MALSAIQRGDLLQLGALLEPHSIDDPASPELLHVAVIVGSSEAAALLLRAGCDPCSRVKMQRLHDLDMGLAHAPFNSSCDLVWHQPTPDLAEPWDEDEEQRHEISAVELAALLKRAAVLDLLLDSAREARWQTLFTFALHGSWVPAVEQQAVATLARLFSRSPPRMIYYDAVLQIATGCGSQQASALVCCALVQHAVQHLADAPANIDLGGYGMRHRTGAAELAVYIEDTAAFQQLYQPPPATSDWFCAQTTAVKYRKMTMLRWLLERSSPSDLAIRHAACTANLPALDLLLGSGVTPHSAAPHPDGNPLAELFAHPRWIGLPLFSPVFVATVERLVKAGYRLEASELAQERHRTLYEAAVLGKWERKDHGKFPSRMREATKCLLLAAPRSRHLKQLPDDIFDTIVAFAAFPLADWH